MDNKNGSRWKEFLFLLFSTLLLIGFLSMDYYIKTLDYGTNTVYSKTHETVTHRYVIKYIELKEKNKEKVYQMHFVYGGVENEDKDIYAEWSEDKFKEYFGDNNFNVITITSSSLDLIVCLMKTEDINPFVHVVNMWGKTYTRYSFEDDYTEFDLMHIENEISSFRDNIAFMFDEKNEIKNNIVDSDYPLKKIGKFEKAIIIDKDYKNTKTKERLFDTLSQYTFNVLIESI